MERKFSSNLIWLWIHSSSVPLFIYNPYSKQLILLVVKKPDVGFAHSCAKHHFVLGRHDLRESEISYVVTISRVQCISKEIEAFSLFIGFTIAEDYKDQPWLQGLLFQYKVKKLNNIFLDINYYEVNQPILKDVKWIFKYLDYERSRSDFINEKNSIQQSL